MFKKIFKKIRKVLKPVGKAFKKVMKPFAKIQQKLGPVGTMALMFIAPYALPAIWGAFGAWAGVGAGAAAGGAASFQALAPGIQTLMKGIYTAGAKIGAAYNTVTGFISDTVGKIAGNTIGKIPIGAEGKTLGSMWSNFTDNLSMKMQKMNLEYGKGLKAADGTMSKSFNVATGKANTIKSTLNKIQGAPGSVQSQITESLLDPTNFVNRPPVGAGTNFLEGTLGPLNSTSPLAESFMSEALQPQKTSTLFDTIIKPEGTFFETAAKESLATMQPLTDFQMEGMRESLAFNIADPEIDVITGLKHKDVFVDAKFGKGKNKVLRRERLDSLVPEYTKVRQSVLNANPQILAEAELLNSYVADVNSFSGQFMGEGAPLYEPNVVARMRAVKDSEEVLGGLETLTTLATGQDEQDRLLAEQRARDARLQNLQLAQSIAPVGYSGIQDFSSDFSNLSSTYSAAGYGPQTSFTTPQSQYEAGAYGGAGFMNQVSSRFLQPTIGMPRLA